MKVKIKNLNPLDIQTDGKTIKMGLSPDSQSMIFEMFTNSMYQNPIGSIVREIASNCFDSHVEAGTELPSNPVIIKKTYDKVANQHYISFFDNGVGMSPERVENIYGMYFNSTKRSGNDQIGGFGIGGKSPLAYTDTFSVITRYNGIEYQYIIFKGKESPEIKDFTEMSTKKKNGTEVRIPIHSTDISRFQYEIKRQLYYFENIVYVGFDNDEELNTYNIYKGKHFLYRGDGYESQIHVCLGKVAYKISYSDLGINSYDNNISIGLKFDIGELTVTPNRESLQYNNETIEIIKDKLELAKQEIIDLLSKQYDNVQTLEQYYYSLNNFGYLSFKDQSSLYVGNIVDRKEISFNNFKYKELNNIPDDETIIKLFYNHHEYGKNQKRNNKIKICYGQINDKIYQCKDKFNRKVVKQSYLSYLHNKKYIILKPNHDVFINESLYEHLKYAFGFGKTNNVQLDLTETDNLLSEKKIKKLLKSLANEVYDWVNNNFESYDDLTVPEEFIIARKKDRLSKEIINSSIVLTNTLYNSKRRVKIKNIINFKGKIYYGTTDDECKVRLGLKMYRVLFGNKHIDRFSYSNQSFNEGKGIFFATVAKVNEKYMKMSDNCYHIDTVYPTLLHRKMINFSNVKIANDYIEKYDDLNFLYKNKEFKIISKTVGNYIEKIHQEIEELKGYIKFSDINFNNDLINNWIKNPKADLKIKTDKYLNYLYDIQERNNDVLKWVNLPYYGTIDLNNDKYSGLVNVLKKVLVF